MNQYFLLFFLIVLMITKIIYICICIHRPQKSTTGINAFIKKLKIVQ